MVPSSDRPADYDAWSGRTLEDLREVRISSWSGFLVPDPSTPLKIHMEPGGQSDLLPLLSTRQFVDHSH